LYQAVDDIREGYRRSVCGVDSIYYRVDGDIVEIMAILGQQDVDNWI
jgi:toxin ParE1/3/4